MGTQINSLKIISVYMSLNLASVIVIEMRLLGVVLTHDALKYPTEYRGVLLVFQIACFVAYISRTMNQIHVPVEVFLTVHLTNCVIAVDNSTCSELRTKN